MKNNKYCKRENQQAHQFNANPVQFILGLCVILGVSSVSVRANDNPAQAAARVALEQKIYELDHAQTLPSSAPVTRSEAVVKQPAKSGANVTATVSPKTVTPQTAQAPKAPVAAPAAIAPTAIILAGVTPTTVAPTAVAHRMVILMLSLLALSSITLSVLLLKVVLQNARNNQDSIGSGDYNSQTNPVTLRLKARDR
jgi:hypothetical protein